MEITTGIDEIINCINIKYNKNIFLRNIFSIILNKIKNNEKKPFDLHHICSSLCISERTLYRRLNDNNKTYLDIKDEVRKGYACYLLSLRKYTVGQISRCLFFKNTSSFIQSFKRWYGYTPNQWENFH